MDNTVVCPWAKSVLLQRVCELEGVWHLPEGALPDADPSLRAGVAGIFGCSFSAWHTAWAQETRTRPEPPAGAGENQQAAVWEAGVGLPYTRTRPGSKLTCLLAAEASEMCPSHVED